MTERANATSSIGVSAVDGVDPPQDVVRRGYDALPVTTGDADEPEHYAVLDNYLRT